MSEPTATEEEINPENFTDRYVVLRGENQPTEGGNWSTEWLLSEYVRATDGIIGKIDGTIPAHNEEVYVKEGNGLKKERKDLPPPTSVIYLDKSARPVQWFVYKLWPVLARTSGTKFNDGEVPKRPKEYFVNIDKMEWLTRMGVPFKDLEDASPEQVNIDTIDREHLARIRAVFSTKEISEDNLDEVWDYPTRLDGQHILIVDEVKSSGQTLNVAQMLISAAIPEATFSGDYWAKPKRIALNRGVEVDGRLQFKIEWVPVWYKEYTASGRGIGDTYPSWPERRERRGHIVSMIQKLGRHFLSTPTHNLETDERVTDKLALQLRADINQISTDLSAGRVFFRPSAARPTKSDEEYQEIVDRIEGINKISFKDWQEKRKSLEPKSR